MNASRTANRIRSAAAAGRFYPADANALQTAVRDYVDGAEPAAESRDALSAMAGLPGSTELTEVHRAIHGHSLKGIIAPHAGYLYSGPIAGYAYARLSGIREQIQRVVVLGPAHFVPVRGLAAPSAASFATPLGEIEIDQAAIKSLLAYPQVVVDDAAHAREHSLEVHLPFLQVALGRFRIVPIVVGEATIDEVAEIVEVLWGGAETLFVISSDLSHFHSHDEAAEIDAQTSRLIESMKGEALDGSRACGFKAIGGFLRVAKGHSLTVERLDLRNSGDTAGPRDRVVGYGSYAIG